ncbi:carbohydrate binding domain-containing protein [Spirochaeta dissipatitropha]
MKKIVLIRWAFVLIAVLGIATLSACRNPVVTTDEPASAGDSLESTETSTETESGDFSGMTAVDTETDGATIWNVSETDGDRSITVTDNYTGTDFSVAIVNGNIEINIIDGGDEAWKVQLVEELEKLTTGTDYVMTFAAKASVAYDISASMEFAQIWDDDPANRIDEVTIAESGYSLTTDFETYTLEFTATDDPDAGANRSEVIKLNLGNIEDVIVTISSITLTEAE